MRSDLAYHTESGEIVYNCFMEPLTVLEKIISASNNNINFVVRDCNNNTHSYNYEDLYLRNLEGEDDAEKCWIDWAKDNKDFLITFDHIETTKEVFKVGFGRGFEHRLKYSYEEMMQK